MPGGPSNEFDADRFAALVGRYDTGNPSEAEAINAARAMRRMVSSNGLRIVDVLERADVRHALDNLLQPVREESVELKQAFEKITQLAEMLAQERRNREHRKLGGLVNGGLVAVVTLAVMALMVAAAFR
jgi:hypothetical protein